MRNPHAAFSGLSKHLGMRVALLPMLVVIAVFLAAQGCTRHSVAPVPGPPPSSPSTPYGKPSARATPPPRPASPGTEPAPGSTAPRPARTDVVAEKCLVSPNVHQTVTHEVGPLETVWRLSRVYDVSEEAICAANNLRPGVPIHVGQKLVIPNARGMRNVIALYPSTRWKFIVVHHTATDIGKAALIDRSHQDRGFWYGLGYHFLIDNGTLGKGDGQIEVAPRWVRQQPGAHCKAGGMNEKAIGVALVGNFNEDLPTQAQMDSLMYLLRTLCSHYGISPRCVVGHRDVDGAATDCPGKRFPWVHIRRCLVSP